MSNNHTQVMKKYMKSKMMLTCLLNRETDRDIISWLGKQENRSEAIREALREAMAHDD